MLKWEFKCAASERLNRRAESRERRLFHFTHATKQKRKETESSCFHMPVMAGRLNK